MIPQLETHKVEHHAPVAGTIFNLLKHFDSLFDHQTSIAREHPTFRLLELSRSEIFTANPANVEHILKTSFSKYSKGECNYIVVKDLLGDGIFSVDGEKWRHQRKLASYEFSTKVLRDFSSVVFRGNASKLVHKVSDAANTGSSVDLQDLFMKSTLDSIFKVGFGVELNSFSGSDDLGTWFSKAFDESNFIVFGRFVDLFWKIKRFLNIGSEAALKRNMKVIDDFVFELIRRKREQMNRDDGDKSKEDILSRLLIESKREPEKMTDRYLRDIILNFIIADEDDVLPDGYKVKKGDGVNYMGYAMGRMTYIWGEDAEDFRPERWLHNGIFRPESPFKFVAFQGGPRICLGKEFAYRQMKILAAVLVYFYRFKLFDQNKKATYRTMFTLHMDEGLRVFALHRLN
ncbi:hypothetical protein QJS10_CPA10g00745 [Acorus calamus]|uniref:Cytochrome P450 n=1 Tax=Acorus calamus TaxID=4465 RepID=A0AAV9E5S6_ACOCL|nr:hypothetical protein QJS10_CPA10g00745 [Acorus calamus]